jgi:hypothetical protein
MRSEPRRERSDFGRFALATGDSRPATLDEEEPMSLVRPIRSGKEGPMPAAEEKGGDQRAGFELAVDKPRRVVRLRLWGFWDLPIAEEFRRAIFKTARGLEGASWGVVADSREFLAQTAVVSDIREKIMERLLPMGCTRIGAIVEDAPVYAMQFSRIASESQMGAAVFHDEDAALAWVSDHARGL